MITPVFFFVYRVYTSDSSNENSPAKLSVSFAWKIERTIARPTTEYEQGTIACGYIN